MTQLTPHIIQTKDSFHFLLKPTNVLILIWSFFMYFMLFVVINQYHNGPPSPENLKSLIDFVFLFAVFLLAFLLYFFIPDDQKYSAYKTAANATVGFVNQPLSIVPVGLSLGVFYLFTYFFNLPKKSIFIGVLETGLWVLLTLLIMVNFFKLVLAIDVMV